MKGIPPILFLALLPAWFSAQTAGNAWRDISQDPVALSLAGAQPEGLRQFRPMLLDTSRLLAQLAGAPREGSGAPRPTLALPLADGRQAVVEIEETTVMEPGLRERYPRFRTYRGISRTPGIRSARLDWTAKGFHAAIETTTGLVYIDPYPDGRRQYYFAYDTPAGPSEPNALLMHCATAPHAPSAPRRPEADVDFRDEPSATVSLRTYRLAMACTGEFTQYHGGTRARALSAIVTQVNRLNQVFERDLAIRVVLVARNDSIIYLNPASDPYSNGDVNKMLDENTPVLNQRIGFQNYDLGHVLGTYPSLQGVALLGSICSTVKGSGVSTIRQPEGDAFVISIVAHEMGHQFDANHTFNSCGENVNPPTSFEPGGGTTIMSYAGICGAADNLQSFTDPYYHVGSLDEIFFHTRRGNGNTCATQLPTANREPEVRIPRSGGFFIPIGTPFELTAEASDPDGDALTYCWEEYDVGPTNNPPGSAVGNAPIFRSLPPSESPIRIFPGLEKIIKGQFDKSEVLPTYSRNLTFRCTVRDNNPAGGGVDWAQIAFRTDSTAGPFRLTQPNEASVRWKAGSYQEVRWNVANTTNSRVNCQYVNIRLSLDGGRTFPMMLLELTPNDGAAFITVPDTVSNSVRVRIEAADNIFFDLSDASFEIWPPSTPGYTLEVRPVTILLHCLPQPLTFDIRVGSVLGYDTPLTLALLGDLPPTATYSFSSNPVRPLSDRDVRLTINLGAPVEDQFRLRIRITGPNQDTAFRDLEFRTVSNNFSRLRPLAPVDGAGGIQLSTSFRWTDAPDAESYEFELASSPAFGQTILESATGLTDTVYVPVKLLADNQLLFWRIRPVNECGPGPYSAPQVFQTVLNSCNLYTSANVPVNISGTGRPTIESSLFIDREGLISDVNIPLIRANYQPVKSLKFSLISPAGTEVVLYNQNCGNTVNFRTGYDDEAPRPIVCPPDDEIVFRPVDPLARFDGENTFGAWKLRVQVVAAGFGASGGLDSWNLEFCADILAGAPVLLNNDTLFVPPAEANLITRDLLEASDDEADPGQLSFLLTTLPRHGVLRLGADTLRAGDRFTQGDINAFRLSYVHGGGEAIDDSFLFIVQNDKGGLLPTRIFQIVIDKNATASTFTPPMPVGFALFPNPAAEAFQIRFDALPQGPLTLRLTTPRGQVVYQWVHALSSREITLPVAQLPAGVYFLSVYRPEGIATRKVIIAR